MSSAALPIPDEAPRTIEEVLAIMGAIEAALPEHDGVARFNKMYRMVTEDVYRASIDQEFEDRAFLVLLDAVFADLYFRALQRFTAGGEDCPRAWVPLFESRSATRIAPLQFALAGMNAHINRDLVVALVDTFSSMGVELRRDTPQHRDYLVVNKLLAQAQEKIEPMFKTGWLGWLDRVLGRVDEVAQMWSIERAREAAWFNAEALWRVRDATELKTPFLATLDRTVGFAGRGLLVRRLF
jgi:hypothetical protein